MTRVAPVIVVLALAYVLLVHPERLAYTLAGFACGVVTVASLPWFVRWGQRVAKDSEDNGPHGVRAASGQTSRPLGAPKPMPPLDEPITRNRRIPIDIFANMEPTLATLEANRRVTVRSFERAGVPIPPEARVPVTSIASAQASVSALAKAWRASRPDRRAN